MKKALKVILIILLVPAILIGGFLFLFAGKYSRVYRDIRKYDQHIQEIANAALLMPDLDTLTDCTDIQYSYKVTCYSTFVGFYSDALALFVTYDESQYDERKLEALANYEFLREPIWADASSYELPVTEFDYKGYTMKVVPDEDYIDYSACKSFLLLGFNDEECKIAYLYYYDFDIDYIAEVGDDLEEEMRELVDMAFSWAG